MADENLAASLMVHRAALLRYLRARGAGDEAEDLLQELWLKIGNVADIVVTDRLAYLYRMAHNLMLDRRRAAMRRQTREQSYHHDVGPGDADDAPQAERTLIARQQLDRVERTLRALGERTDFIFRRHRVDGVAQRDIATELAISLSAVEKHLQKAYRAVAAAQRAGHDDIAVIARETADGVR